MKDETKATLIDEILHGKEIYVTVSNHLPNDKAIHPGHMKIWVLYGGQPYRELFRWKSDQPSIAIKSNPVTLKEALALIDEHWENRLDPGRFTHPVLTESADAYD